MSSPHIHTLLKKCEALNLVLLHHGSEAPAHFPHLRPFPRPQPKPAAPILGAPILSLEQPRNSLPQCPPNTPAHRACQKVQKPSKAQGRPAIAPSVQVLQHPQIEAATGIRRPRKRENQRRRTLLRYRRCPVRVQVQLHGDPEGEAN